MTWLCATCVYLLQTTTVNVINWNVTYMTFCNKCGNKKYCYKCEERGEA